MDKTLERKLQEWLEANDCQIVPYVVGLDGDAIRVQNFLPRGFGVGVGLIPNKNGQENVSDNREIVSQKR